MSSPPRNGEHIARLPFQIRPVAGEGGTAFIRRLARANSLKPGYLRRFLKDPSASRGTPSWERLGTLTGRDPDRLRDTLESTKCRSCGARIPPGPRFGRPAYLCSTRCRRRVQAERVLVATCRICQLPMKIQFGQRHRLCSTTCRRTAYLLRKRDETEHVQPEAADPSGGARDGSGRTCRVCEKPLPMTSRPSAQLCSSVCRVNAYRWDKTSSEAAFTVTTTACERCDRPILISSSSPQTSRRWCSGSCRARAKRT